MHITGIQSLDNDFKYTGARENLSKKKSFSCKFSKTMLSAGMLENFFGTNLICGRFAPEITSMAHNPIPISRLRHSWGIRLIRYTSTLTILAEPLVQMAKMFTNLRARPPFDNQLPRVGRILGEQLA